MENTFIEKKILEYIYNESISSNDYYHNYTIEEIKKGIKINEVTKNEIFYALSQLSKSKLIKPRSLPNKIDFRITIEGLLNNEINYLKEKQIFTSYTVKILEFLKKVDDGKIELTPEKNNKLNSYPTSEFFKNIECSEEIEQDKVVYILREIVYHQDYNEEGLLNHECLSFSPEKLYFYYPLNLTAKGKNYLTYHQKLKNLFSSIKDEFGKEILLEEYLEIENLRKRERWKDAVIKIGSILECLITFYIEQNKLDYDDNGNIEKKKIHIAGKEELIKPSNAVFSKKLAYIIQNTIFGIENNNDWMIVDSLIRDLRNLIHLQKYIRNKTKINKDLFDKLYPAFERLITLF